MGRPSPSGGGIVKREWLENNRWASFPLILDQQLIVVDCSFKDGSDNSWVVMQCWGRRGADAYLLGQLREHLDLPGTIAALLRFCAVWTNATAKYVEDKANGPGVVQMLRNRIPGLMTTNLDESCLKSFCSGSKASKLSAVAPYLQAGNVHIPTADALVQRGERDWTPEYVHELTAFPGGRNDDQVDCTAMGVWKLLHHAAAFGVEVDDYLQETLNMGRSPVAGLEANALGLGGGLAETIRNAW